MKFTIVVQALTLLLSIGAVVGAPASTKAPKSTKTSAPSKSPSVSPSLAPSVFPSSSPSEAVEESCLFPPETVELTLRIVADAACADEVSTFYVARHSSREVSFSAFAAGSSTSAGPFLLPFSGCTLLVVSGEPLTGACAGKEARIHFLLRGVTIYTEFSMELGDPTMYVGYGCDGRRE